MNHVFYDGYGIKEELISKSETLIQLMATVTERYFSDKPFKNSLIFANQNDFPNIRQEDEGISLVVLGDARHFTCHTYPHRGITFGDLCVPSDVSIDAFQNQMQNILHAEHVDDCKRSIAQGKYGKHVIMQFDQFWRIEEAVQIVKNIRISLGMSMLSDMMVNTFDDGYDILQPIVESHIALHANKAQRWMSLDIFSCRNFEEAIVRETLRPFSTRLIQRGVYF